MYLHRSPITMHIHNNMSRPARKLTLWHLRKCIDPDQPAQSAHTDPGRHIPSQRYRVMIPETEIQSVYPGKPARHA